MYKCKDCSHVDDDIYTVYKGEFIIDCQGTLIDYRAEDQIAEICTKCSSENIMHGLEE